MSITEAQEIDQAGKVNSKRRFDTRDWSYVAEWIIEEWTRRKNARTDRDRHWDEIDRQIAMEPNVAFKKLPDGRIDTRKRWMSEVELPLQAQALEVLSADARRLMFADSWFRAHAATTDEYLKKVDFQSLILGDELEVPSRITQDNADKLIEGFLLNIFKQNDFNSRQDRINAEAFKYGMGVGRARLETKNVYIHESRGVRKETQRIPVLVPCSIKNLYLDDPLPSMHSAQVLGPGHIAYDRIQLASLQLAASKGSVDPNNEDGGWMPAAGAGLVADDKGFVHVLEFEGDLVVRRKTTKSMVLPGCVVTVVLGQSEKKDAPATRAVIRFRWRKSAYSSYLLYPYQFEGADDTYPTSPLEKGRPVQIAATEAVNRLLDSAMLKIAPPVAYDRSDMEFGQKGGPEIAPYAQWGTIDAVTVYDTLGGDPTALTQMLTLFVNLYGELTGVLPARLGSQTVSHTTAFAKDAEISRGAARTVNYVNRSGEGPLTRWLYMAYDMGRKALGKSEQISFWIPAYGGYVQVSGNQLPESAEFEWFGSGGPTEAQTKAQRKLQALQLAVQMDSIAIQTGKPATVNIPASIKQVLREGGWTDIDAITNAQSGAAAPPVQANPGAASVALEALSQAGQQ